MNLCEKCGRYYADDAAVEITCCVCRSKVCPACGQKNWLGTGRDVCNYCASNTETAVLVLLNRIEELETEKYYAEADATHWKEMYVEVANSTQD